MSSDCRLLFLRPVFAIGSSFVKVDLELLGRHFAVTPMAARPGDRLLSLRLLRAARKHDLCFVWFADARAYQAVNVFHLLSKPVVIVPGQYEIACHPEGGYGLQLEDKRRWRRGMSALLYTCVSRLGIGLSAAMIGFRLSAL